MLGNSCLQTQLDLHLLCDLEARSRTELKGKSAYRSALALLLIHRQKLNCNYAQVSILQVHGNVSTSQYMVLQPESLHSLYKVFAVTQLT